MSGVPDKAELLHRQLFVKLDGELAPETEEFDRLKCVVVPYLGKGGVRRCKNVIDMLDSLEDQGHIKTGDYGTLEQIFTSASLLGVWNSVSGCVRAIADALASTETTTDSPQRAGSMSTDEVTRIKLESDEWRAFCRNKIQDKFVMTGSYHRTREAIEQKSSVMLLAGSGDGKSAIVQYLVTESEYLPIEITSPTEIKSYVDRVRNTKTKLLFILDDVVGGSYLMRQMVDDWIRLGNSLEMYMGPHKFLLASRKSIWEQCRVQLQGSKLFSNTVDVSSNKLTTEDKIKLLENYLGSSGKLTDPEKKHIVSNIIPIAYSQCCQLMQNAIEEGKSGAELIKIFEKPFTFLNKEMEKMAEIEKLHHATLCLIMLCGGELKCRELTCILSKVTPDVRERIEVIWETCGCEYPLHVAVSNFRDSAEKFTGSFLKKRYKTGENSSRYEVYTFSHDSICEAVTMQYGDSHFPLCLQFLPADLIVKISRPHSYEKDEHEFVVCVPDEVENNRELARVFTEAAIVGNWSLFDVFQNPFVQDENFHQFWVEYLKSHPDKQTAFLESKSWDGQCVYHLSARSYAHTLFTFLNDDVRVKCSCLPDFSSPLCEAAKHGDKQTVTNLMTSYKQTDLQIHRAFITACRHGRINVLELLLQGINHDRSREDTRATGLREACLGGQRELVEYMLEKYYSPCRKDTCGCKDGMVWASMGGKTDIVVILLSHGAETCINSIDHYGWTGLHWAAMSGHTQIVETLLRHGADANITDRLHNQSALGCAKQQGHTVIVDMLAKHGDNGDRD